MAKPLDELRERLLRAGVAPRHVRRYLTELTEHLADLKAEEERTGRSRAEAEMAALARLGSMDELAAAMTGERRLQSWSARAPWAMFGLAPIAALAAAWFIALFILWSGWHMFLPEAETPFRGGPLYGFENIYFQFGRMIYFYSPFFIGWSIGLIAARQRLAAIWPGIALALIAFFAGTAQVHASRTAVQNGVGHISMGFGFGASGQGLSDGLVHIAVILSVTALPYLIWRWHSARGLSA
jgi:hypothetical protein